MNTNSLFTIMMLGAAFLLSAITLGTQQQNAFASLYNDIVNTQTQQVITTSEAPVFVLTQERIEIDDHDYVLIVYSDNTSKLTPVDSDNNDDISNSITVKVDDNKSHNNDDKKESTQDDFNKKYSGLPDDGTLSDDDNPTIPSKNDDKPKHSDVKSDTKHKPDSKHDSESD